MSAIRAINKAVDVTMDPRGEPAAFRWQRSSIRVKSIIDVWREAGCWWDGEEGRTVYLVEGAPGSTYELHRVARQAWVLAKIYD